ncbi:MAG TPA: hypothetical protein VHV57_13985 [Acidimicrobiales bacterium]|jgi:hypothetical protein|nr:hypothetical protein [Acidimicrobiales bacterium]
MSAKSKDRVSPGDRRLFAGYGPAVLIIAAFFVMAILVPSVAPEKDVSANTTGSSKVTSGGGGLGGLTNSSTTTTPAVGGAGASPGANSTTGTAAGAVPSTTPNQVAGCAGPQVAGDPYSPPCISFNGNNGGATTRGVTSNQIVITYMNPTDGSKSVDQSIESVTGSYNSVIFPETYAQEINTLQELVTYFNKHFQFYGRQIVLKVINGQEDGAGDNAGNVQADALNVADDIKAFAEINGTSEAYVNALSAQHVLNFSGVYDNEAGYQANAPYSWSDVPDCTEIGQDVGSVVTKDLVGQPTSFGGTGVANGEPRKFAVVYDDLPYLSSCATEMTSALSAAGQPATTTIGYSTDQSVATATAQSTVQQLINDNVTTVLCMCDPLGELLFADDMQNDHYQPEWVEGGVVGEETDDIAQEMPQSVWAHTVVITSEESLAGKYGSTLAYFAAKSEDPNNALIVNEVDVLYQRLYQLALGIELAGPNLTPQSFEQGILSYKGGNGAYGPQTYVYNGVDYFSPVHQYKIQWYNPSAISQSDGAQGTWVSNNTWYSSPPSPLPVFPNGPQ